MLIDVTRLADRYLQGRLPTGVDRVSLAYLDHFGEKARALVRFGGRWIELPFSDSQRLFSALLGGQAAASSFVRWLVARAYATSWRQSPATVLFNTGHSGLDSDDYAIRVRERGLRPVFFLHDLIPISHPEYCRAGEAERHHRRLDTMLSVGRGLVVNSRATLYDLEAYAGARQLALPPCAVAPLAPGSLPAPSRGRPLEKPYFVVLGTIEPRKNHLLLLHMWRRLVAELGEAAPQLVVIGQRGWECEQVVDLLDRCTALQGHVAELPRCGDQELATWLAHAQALLFPSFTEGFGMPLVEALTLGVPVIASDLPVFREVAGGIPDYLDPIDGLGWYQRVLGYLAVGGPMRCAQRVRMEGFRAPTWGEHFTVVESLLDRVGRGHT